MQIHQDSIEFEEAVCTSSDGQAIYITAHLFFEDLANLEKIIPQDESPESTSQLEEEELALDRNTSDGFSNLEDPEHLRISEIERNTVNPLPTNKFYIKKGFCLLSKRM